MEIYLFRHGIAEDLKSHHRSDSDRHLTEEGVEKTTKVAKAFKNRIDGLDLILHSPYVRARETAAILAKEFSKAKLEPVNHFRPDDDPVEAERILAKQKCERLLVVSHQPFLGLLASYLLVGNYKASIEFKKAAVAGFDYGGAGESSLFLLAAPRFLT